MRRNCVFRKLRILHEHLDRSDWSMEHRIETLPEITPEVFRSEYVEVCEDIKEEINILSVIVERIISPEIPRDSEMMDDAEKYFAKVKAHFGYLEQYHAAFLQRFKERAETDSTEVK